VFISGKRNIGITRLGIFGFGGRILRRPRIPLGACGKGVFGRSNGLYNTRAGTQEQPHRSASTRSPDLSIGWNNTLDVNKEISR
jgi:hypothetical protein